MSEKIFFKNQSVHQKSDKYRTKIWQKSYVIIKLRNEKRNESDKNRPQIWQMSSSDSDKIRANRTGILTGFGQGSVSDPGRTHVGRKLCQIRVRSDGKFCKGVMRKTSNDSKRSFFWYSVSVKIRAMKLSDIGRR
jgi:hypothetical protein